MYIIHVSRKIADDNTSQTGFKSTKKNKKYVFMGIGALIIAIIVSLTLGLTLKDKGKYRTYIYI